MQKLNDESGDTAKTSEEPRQFDTLARNMVRLFYEGSKALGALAERSQNGSGPYSMAAEAGEAAKSLGEIARHWVSDPAKLATTQGDLFKGYAEPKPRRVHNEYLETLNDGGLLAGLVLLLFLAAVMKHGLAVIRKPAPVPAILGQVCLEYGNCHGAEGKIRQQIQLRSMILE
jgi:hypothetical protein